MKKDGKFVLLSFFFYIMVLKVKVLAYKYIEGLYKKKKGQVIRKGRK